MGVFLNLVFMRKENLPNSPGVSILQMVKTASNCLEPHGPGMKFTKATFQQVTENVAFWQSAAPLRRERNQERPRTSTRRMTFTVDSSGENSSSPWHRTLSSTVWDVHAISTDFGTQ